MAESPVRDFKQIDRETLDAVVLNFLDTIGNLDALTGRTGTASLDEQAQAVEHIGRCLRDECCAAKLRGHAMLAKQILTIATTRMA